jgi:hypothetical protein
LQGKARGEFVLVQKRSAAFVSGHFRQLRIEQIARSRDEVKRFIDSEGQRLVGLAVLLAKDTDLNHSTFYHLFLAGERDHPQAAVERISRSFALESVSLWDDAGRRIAEDGDLAGSPWLRAYAFLTARPCIAVLNVRDEDAAAGAAVLDRGGEGIGLYRTEYSYLNRTDLPGEEELAEKYADLASIMSPRRVIFRTLDLGADKFIQSFGSLEEANPSMGLRAIRFCLRHPDLFRTQLRAICRASAYGNASIMFPMISGLKELRRAKALLRDVQDELKRERVPFNEDMPVGIMVELPSAVMIAEFLAEECDFFSIGTNDLIQYSMGIDRTNRHVSYLYQPLHPSVLRAIKHIIDAAHQAGIEVSLCGEVASDPFCVPIIMGMQVDSISLTPQAIPGIKRVIRQARMSDCRDLLREVLACRTVGRVNRLVKDTIFKQFPEELTFFASLLDNEEHGG